MKYISDINICIFIIRKHSENVLKKFKGFNIDDICISSITLAELMLGVQKNQHQHKDQIALQEFIIPLDIMPFNEEAAFHYGCIRAILENNGKPIGSMDMMIAAHALSLNATLVTNNKKEFPLYLNLKSKTGHINSFYLIFLALK